MTSSLYLFAISMEIDDEPINSLFTVGAYQLGPVISVYHLTPFIDFFIACFPYQSKDMATARNK